MTLRASLGDTAVALSAIVGAILTVVLGAAPMVPILVALAWLWLALKDARREPSDPTDPFEGRGRH